MSLQILYTDLASETLKNIYQLIEHKFGERAADTFLSKAEKSVTLIAEHPFMFKATSIDVNVRKCIITRQTSLFYRVTETSVHLLYFWDNRQEPFFL